MAVPTVGDRSGFVQLDRTVASIRVGHRHRSDLGDLTELVDSIRTMGMLQPITVSPDGVLICGARRLAAAHLLGWRRISVWVRAGISTPLQKLLAKQHDNTIRKAFSPAEEVSMYAELKVLLAEEAARRQHASRFGADLDGGCGSADSAEPSGRETRAQAARLVSGRQSYTRFEQVLALRRFADDPGIDQQIRESAVRALANIDIDGKVDGPDRRFKAVEANVIANEQTDTPTDETHGRGGRTVAARRRRTRAFLLVQGDLSGWTSKHDATELGPALDEEQWAEFQAIVAAIVEFCNAARDARHR